MYIFSLSRITYIHIVHNLAGPGCTCFVYSVYTSLQANKHLGDPDPTVLFLTLNLRVILPFNKNKSAPMAWTHGPQQPTNYGFLPMHPPRGAWVFRLTFFPSPSSSSPSPHHQLWGLGGTVLYCTVLYCTVLSSYGEARPGGIHPPKVNLCGESHRPHETECRLLLSLLRRCLLLLSLLCRCVKSRLHTESSSHRVVFTWLHDSKKHSSATFYFRKMADVGCVSSPRLDDWECTFYIIINN